VVLFGVWSFLGFYFDEMAQSVSDFGVFKVRSEKRKERVEYSGFLFSLFVNFLSPLKQKMIYRDSEQRNDVTGRGDEGDTLRYSTDQQ